ncbi:HAD-IB family hydrolase [Demequina sp. TTPB684]|uniref:HAD family hydrolase n=1 Tax=unclassified Demequina TaxID=2620311 RepID=UPI001CF3532C|nr:MULTISPECIES: HAD-IB family hydrolase [unclassified Demequina]MCB2411416.1 HAD-IB family hydrolase [Demequina sp. TTPB684]UPU88291.1 HAD-IB family hydrolase [Demequina sp. TMPB413]
MTRQEQVAPNPVAAFFDVDNTVIRGASAFHIARGLKQRGYFRNRDLIRFAWEQLKYLVFGESQEQMTTVRSEALSIIKGWSVAEMAAIGEEVYDEILAMRIFPGTKALIDEHRAQGHEVWFVTASPVEIGRLIARRLNATGALGTIAEHKGGLYTGRLVGDMMHGEAKAVAVRELAARKQLDLSRCFAYGDSMNDAPMLTVVGHGCAINPDSRLRRHAKKLGWPIQDFRGRNPQGRRSIVRRSLTGFVWILLKVLRSIGHTLLTPFRARKRRRLAATDDAV